MNRQPTLEDVKNAHRRIKPFIHRTPVLTCCSLDEMVGAKLFFKGENFQKVGAFKFRGACNAILSLSQSAAAQGVITHSSGNHAAALALAARMRGVTARIVMPSNAPLVKVAAVKNYGGIISFCEPTQASRESTAAEIIEQTGATFVHPYNDRTIIAGQGSSALELMEDVPDLDFILTPVGGGGLLSGTAIVAKALNKQIKVVAGEPRNADDAFRSLQAGKILPSLNPNTIADGLKTSLGDLTFPIIQQLVDDIVLVEEQEIISAMQTVFERMKIIIEPSSAVPVAVLLFQKLKVTNKKVGIILSGGNVEFNPFFERMLNQDGHGAA